MIKNKRKVVLIGAGQVGMSYAYAMLNKGTCDELVIIDVNTKKAAGEAEDLSNGLPFAPVSIKISADGYQECADAQVVAITAGVSQQPGESREQLLNRNAEIFKGIIPQVMQSGFNGVFLIATNPVDVLTMLVQKVSGLPAGRVIGTGTVLDSARLRLAIGEQIGIDSKSVHAYILGEHGDSEFVPWSQAALGNMPLLKYERNGQKVFTPELCKSLEDSVRASAYRIIEAKGATCYGIGMSMARITTAIVADENSILTVSSMADGQYDLNGVSIGLPAIVGREGVREIFELQMTAGEFRKLYASAEIVKRAFEGIV